MKHITCILLILAFLMTFYSVGVSASENGDYSLNSITFVVDKEGDAYELSLPIIIKDGEFYIEPQNLADLTRYRFSAEGDRRIFKLGLKFLLIDVSKQTFEVNLSKQAFSGSFLVDGIHYLPMSEILPWMNVRCYVSDGKLHIDSDIKSYWEVIENFDSNDYLFDIAKTYGETTGGIIGLCAISVFDCILDFKNIWKKVVPITNSDTSLYEYEIYRDCFREFALPEVGTGAEIQKLLSEISDVVSDNSQFLNAYYTPIFTQETHDKIEALFGEDIAEGFDEWPTDATQITENLKLAKNALKYMKTGALYARIAMADTTDYAEALRFIYMRKGVTPPSGVELAASEAIVALESQTGAVADAAATVLADIGINLLEKIAEGTVQAAVEDTIFGSLGLYLDIVNATLSLSWPVNKAYAELTKMTVYYGIQYDALNAYYSVETYRSKVKAQDISNARTSAIIFLKTARKCFQAQQDAFDLYGGEGVLDWQIAFINDKILEFQLASLSEENDAIGDKSAFATELKNMFLAIEPVEQPATSGDVQAFLGTWYLYQGGKQDAKGNWLDIAVYTLELLDDGTAGIGAGFVLSECCAGYSGTWDAVPIGDNQFQIQLNVTGGELVLGETWPQNDCMVVLQATVTENLLILDKISGDEIYLIYGEAYERDLSSDTWKERQLQRLNSSMPNDSHLGEWFYGYIPGGIWERTVTINSIEGNTINFDLFYYRLAYFSGQTATINDDGTASFTATDIAKGESISGIFAFGDTVTVYITHSNHPYVDADLQNYTREQKEIPNNGRVSPKFYAAHQMHG